VTVFPNPVRENYEGLITIDGLAYETNVKITDVSGNLVYVTESNGGRATWDGNGMDGSRVTTGVYLIFCTNQEGSTAKVAKVAIVK
jgi:flagellar hook assembly protein FlgD